VDEARVVLSRLERIERLDREGAPPRALLDEVRSLLLEAEAWLAVEPGCPSRAAAAVEGCRSALERAEAGTGTRAGLW
jgi:hypothetical protein